MLKRHGLQRFVLNFLVFLDFSLQTLILPVQFVLLYFLLKKNNSFCIELVFVFKCLHDSVPDAVDFLKVVNFAMTVIYETLLVD